MNTCSICDTVILPTGKRGRPRKWCDDCSFIDGDRCSNKDCDTAALTRGMCAKHYNAWRFSTPCAIDGCEAKLYSKGICRKHYHDLKAWRRDFASLFDPDRPQRVPIETLDPSSAPKRPRKECSEEGCTRRVSGRGLCSTHYHAFWISDKSCIFPGCENNYAAKGGCWRHYERAKRKGVTVEELLAAETPATERVEELLDIVRQPLHNEIEAEVQQHPASTVPEPVVVPVAEAPRPTRRLTFRRSA